jgi:hypothetical protein
MDLNSHSISLEENKAQGCTKLVRDRVGRSGFTR